MEGIKRYEREIIVKWGIKTEGAAHGRYPSAIMKEVSETMDRNYDYNVNSNNFYPQKTRDEAHVKGMWRRGE